VSEAEHATRVVDAHLRIIASGSGGNLSILTLHRLGLPPRHVCIDLGIGPRTLARRLDEHAPDVRFEDIAAVLVTHPDGDHLRSTWRRTLDATEWPVFAAPSHHAALAAMAAPPRLLRPLADGGREITILPGSITATTALAPHDDHGSTAIRLRVRTTRGDLRIGWATDVGRPTEELRSLLSDCEILGVESNYDAALQAASPRPPFLKARITGGHGHLSNVQALDLVRSLANRTTPDRVVLLHLSRECNDPDLVRDLWGAHDETLARRMHVAEQDRPIGPFDLFDRRPVEAAVGDEGGF